MTKSTKSNNPVQALKLKDVINYFKTIYLAPGKKRYHIYKILKLRLLVIIYDLGLKKLTPLLWIPPIKLLLKKDSRILNSNYYFGLLEYFDMGFMIHLLRPGDCFIDVGANKGSYSLLVAGLCGADVIAFEPVQTTYQDLNQNISINELNHKIKTKRVVLTSEKIVKDSPKIFFFDRL